MKMPEWQGSKGNFWLIADEGLKFCTMTHDEMNLAKNHVSELGVYPSLTFLKMTPALLENLNKHAQIPDPETLQDNKCVLF